MEEIQLALSRTMFRMKRIIKNYLQGLFRIRGYELIPSWSIPDLPLTGHLKVLFNHLNIQCVLDVGGHKGGYRDFLRNNVGYNGLIISFEPMKEKIELLKKRAEQDPLWKIEGYALGSLDTQMPINVMVGSECSSFLVPDDSITDACINGNVVDHQELCEIKCLDTIAMELKAKYPLENKFLKIDTQGYDLEVIKGGEKTLSEMMAVQAEICFLRIYKDMPDYFTVIQELKHKGFDVSCIHPIHRDRLLRIVAADCVMINRFIVQDLFTVKNR